MKKFIKAIIFILCIVLPAGLCFTGCSKQKFADAWTYDENYHWHASLDKNSSDVQFKNKHIWSEWVDIANANPEDCKRYKKCEICDYIYYEPVAASEGLNFTLTTYSGSKRCYAVSGIGTCTDANIVIPETYNDLPVKRIKADCFKGLTFIKNVVIPESIINIEENSFKECSSLERVVIGKNVTGVSFSAFSGCTSLKDIVINESNEYYKSIDGNLYSKDGKEMLIYACGKSAESFTVLDTVETIGYGCFKNCNLKSVTISDSVKTIKEYAFQDCTKLESVVLGNNLESIQGYAFIRSAIKSITIPASVTSFGWSCFAECAQLESAVILCNIDKLDDFIFRESGLKTIIIPDSVECIGQATFKECAALESVVIGTNVTSIDYEAFAGITNLTIHYKGSEENWNNITKIDKWNENSSITVDYNYTGTES